MFLKYTVCLVDYYFYFYFIFIFIIIFFWGVVGRGGGGLCLGFCGFFVFLRASHVVAVSGPNVQSKIQAII